MTKITETGKHGLTDWTREYLLWVQRLNPDFVHWRNPQALAVGDGVLAKLPDNERGRPDFECLFRGRFFGLELKSPKKNLRKEQKEQKEKILRAGGDFHVARSQEEVMQILEDYGVSRIREAWSELS